MIVYSNSNVNKLYLNPYVSVGSNGETALFKNCLTGRTMQVKLDLSYFDVLKKGIDRDKYLSYLEKKGLEREKAQSLITLLFQKGVIE